MTGGPAAPGPARRLAGAAGLLGAICLLLGAGSAQAQGRIDEIKARGVLNCAAYERPGLAAAQGGLFPDVCRAVAAAVIGPGARTGFTLLAAPEDAKNLRAGAYDLMFLTAAEIAAAGAEAELAPGPPAFFLSEETLVESGSPLRKPEDLVGLPVCFLQGRSAIRALDQRLALDQGHSLGQREIIRMPFEEEVEMLDAFDVRHCRAMVGEAPQLAALRRDKGVLGLEARFLDPPLAIAPIFATTPRDAQARDIGWEAAIAQIFGALSPAEPAAASTSWPAAGLRRDWLRDLRAAGGDYAQLFARNLGAQSDLKLDARTPLPPPAPAATLNALFAYLDGCLHGVAAPPGAELTIAFALKRDGALLGAPHVAFLRAPTRGDGADFLAAVAERFGACLPAPITDGLGGAIAGRRLTLRFVTPGAAGRRI